MLTLALSTVQKLLIILVVIAPSGFMILAEVIAPLCPSSICVHTPAAFHTLQKIEIFFLKKKKMNYISSSLHGQ